MEREPNGPGRNRETSRGKRRVMILVLLLLFILLLLLFLRKRRAPSLPVAAENAAPAVVTVDTQQLPGRTAAPVDSVVAADTVRETVARKATTPPRRHVRPDTTASSDTVPAADTTSPPDSASADTAPPREQCGNDTMPLWVYPDPSGGLHYREVRVRFVGNRPATIHYRFKDDTAWTCFGETPVTITASTTLYFDAIDTCGNVMERRAEYYEIETARTKSPCHPDMEQVKVGNMDFCIDRYEWPNRRGALPRSYISRYQAADSCATVGKRLCTAEEWMVACAGPYTWKYPYGQRYEPYGCVTHDTMAAPSGSKPECRTFFGAFDMSGNLLEWTDTRAIENGSFSYVMGGFWESGPKSACRDKRYSYYPQNRHNPVGFRCCRDIRKPSGATEGGKQ
ncbi:MAG: SUMF1/EgtB/PvdO family nonheme iron enzyme [Chitinispirillaceae bacterium]|nr:SUMF1/EgtB/PvdO family nonheme iron enzyme [Chitinispirillaceae bacterium]